MNDAFETVASQAVSSSGESWKAPAMRRAICWVLAVLACGPKLLTAGPDRPEREADSSYFRALATGFRANRDAVTGSGHLQFLDCPGLARSVEDALAGHYTGDPPSAQIFWAVAGDTQRYDMVWAEGLNERSMRPGPRGGAGSAAYQSFRVVRNARVHLTQVLSDHPGEDAITPSVQLRRNRGYLRARMRTPFQMLEINEGYADFHDLAYHIEQALVGPQRSLRLEGPRTDLMGRNLSVLAFSRHGRLWLRVWMDRKRGCLPLQMDQFGPGDSRPFVHTVVTDMLECRGAVWLPRRVVVIAPRALTGGKMAALDLKLLDFDAEHQPAPSLFQVKVPPNGAIMDEVTKHALRVGNQGRTVTPQQLEYVMNHPAAATPVSAVAASQAVGPSPTRGMNDLVPDRRHPWPYWVLLGVAALTPLLVGVLWTYYARRKKTSG